MHSTPLTQASHDQQSGMGYGLARKLSVIGLAEPTRWLPDGGIAVNPELSDDQAKFEQAIQNTSASKEAKEAARKRWPAYHEAWLTQATDTLKASKNLPGIQDYNEWLTSNGAPKSGRHRHRQRRRQSRAQQDHARRSQCAEQPGDA